MTLLFHSFPGFLSASRPHGLDLRAAATNGHYKRVALDILRLILRYGLLLCPEPIYIAPNPGSRLATRGEDARPLYQTRASFTAIPLGSLTTPYDAGRANVAGKSRGSSHADLFGAVSIGFDYALAPLFELAPCMYFKCARPFVDVSGADGARSSSFSSDATASLVEARELLVILAWLSERLDFLVEGDTGERWSSRLAVLEQADVCLTHQPAQMQAAIARIVARTSREHLEAVLRFFDTDRRPFWQLVQMIDLQLELLQSADSATGRALAYFRQAEFRIVRLLSRDLAGFFLARPPEAASDQIWDEPRREFLNEFQALRVRAGQAPVRTEELQRYYVLVGASSDGRHHFFRDGIRVVAAPGSWRNEIEDILNESGRWRSFPEGPPEVVPL